MAQKIVCKYNPKGVENVLCRCTCDTDFIPNRTESRSKIWMEQGFMRIAASHSVAV